MRARLIQFAPGSRHIRRVAMITPVLSGIRANVLVPNDCLGWVEKVISVGERTYGHGRLFAHEVQFGIVRHFLHKATRSEQESSR